MRRLRLNTQSALALLPLAALGASAPAHAESYFLGQQAHFRLGLLSGSYVAGNPNAAASSGATAGFGQAVSVPTTIDLELEAFNSTRGSYFVRTTFAENFSTTLAEYFYVGLGKRWYIKSNGMTFETVEGGTTIEMVPKMRYFLGVDGGVALANIQSISAVLSISSAMFDLGAHAGMIYQVGRQLGLEAYVGYSKGFGFTSVAAAGSNEKFLFGASYYF